MSLLFLLLGGFGSWFLWMPIADVPRALPRPREKRSLWTLNIRAPVSPPAPGLLAELEVLARQMAALLRGGIADQSLWILMRDIAKDSALGSMLVKSAALTELGLSPATVFRDIARGSSMSNNRSVKTTERQAMLEFAACLEVSDQSGAPLAEVLDRLADHFDDTIDMHALRRTALAGPQATATLLSWLPLLGVAAGYLMGLDPLSILFGTPLGNISLITGVALMFLARWWMSRMVQIAARPI